LDFNILKHIRHQTYGCFGQSRDALFELTDALICESAARSLPELSLSPCFRRKWPSVYEALSDGRIDEASWSRAWTSALLEEHQGAVWLSVDSTSIARPEAETSPDRGMIDVCNLPHATKPVSVGWQFSPVMLLPHTHSSWGAILSQRRIKSQQTAVSVAVEQVEEQLPSRRSASGGLPAKMEPCFRGANPRPGASQNRSGRAPMSRASRSWCKPGTACISARRERSR
jgi:hypothetical protein